MVSIDGQSDFCIETLHKSIKLRKNTIVYIYISIYIYMFRLKTALLYWIYDSGLVFNRIQYCHILRSSFTYPNKGHESDIFYS